MNRSRYRRHRAPAVLIAVGLAVGWCAPAVGAASGGAHLGQVGATGAAAAQPAPLKERYVVMFSASASDEARAAAREKAQGAGARIHYEYNHAIKGFAATLPAGAVDALRKNPQVTSVEPDFEVRASDSQFPPPSWGLDRIDQSFRPLDNTYTYTATGAGVTAYVIDSGIRATHADFGGRVGGGFTAIDDGVGAGDCNGHGTHVAGTIGGTAYGVAKGVKLVPIRVLDCKGAGSTSGVIAGVDWVVANRASPAVANMSLGGPASTALDTAVANASAAGTTFAVAAGNEATDACASSPARVGPAITVGASTSTDERASFSNYGACLDMFAPGTAITSAGHGSDTAAATLSGTSMAAPHVAGTVALFLQGSPQSPPDDVRAALVGAATADLVREAGTNSPNVLLYSATARAEQPASNQPPPANRAPVAVAPAVILPLAGTQIGTATVPLRISWSGIDPDGDGIAGYQLQQSKDGGSSWANVNIEAAQATSTTINAAPSSGLRYRVRAIDGRGLSGAYATGAVINLAMLQQNAATYASSTAWASHSIDGAYGGTVYRSRTSGSEATLKFTGTQIAWIATLARTRGRAEIFLDGISQGIVDLHSSTTKTRQVLFSRGVGVGTHTLLIRVIGTRNTASSNTYIDVDGFLTTR